MTDCHAVILGESVTLISDSENDETGPAQSFQGYRIQLA